MPAVTCDVVVDFDGFSAPKTVVAVADVLRESGVLPSLIVEEFVYVFAEVGNA